VTVGYFSPGVNSVRRASRSVLKSCSFKHSSRSRPFKAFNESILSRFSWLDEVQAHAVILSPG